MCRPQGFRAAVTQAAEAPFQVAKILEEQAARIAEVSDTAMSRAEFVLARHERRRGQMGELIQAARRKAGLEKYPQPAARRHGNSAIKALGGETRKFETFAGEAELRLDAIMKATVARQPS